MPEAANREHCGKPVVPNTPSGVCPGCLGFELADERRAVELVIIDHIEKLQFPK